MDGHYYLDTYLDSWDRYMNDLTEAEQNELWDQMMYGRNGHNPPAPRKAEYVQPVECPNCRTLNTPEPDGRFYCYVCEFEWEVNES